MPLSVTLPACVLPRACPKSRDALVLPSRRTAYHCATSQFTTEAQALTRGPYKHTRTQSATAVPDTHSLAFEAALLFSHRFRAQAEKPL